MPHKRHGLVLLSLPYKLRISSYLEEPSVISTESFGMDCFRGSLLHALYALQLLVIALSTVAPRQTMQSKLTQCSKVSLSQDLSDICTELEPLKAQLTDCANSKIDTLEGSNCTVAGSHTISTDQTIYFRHLQSISVYS